jgi:succinoglycan biosynthesis transport protein ExoP
VLDPANLPENPSFPNRPLFALGGLAGGLGLGVGLAFFIEMQNTSMRTERDVEFALRLPVLAIVPAVEPMGTKRNNAVSHVPSMNSTLGQGARA